MRDTGQQNSRAAVPLHQYRACRACSYHSYMLYGSRNWRKRLSSTKDVIDIIMYFNRFSRPEKKCREGSALFFFFSLSSKGPWFFVCFSTTLLPTDRYTAGWRVQLWLKKEERPTLFFFWKFEKTKNGGKDQEYFFVRWVQILFFFSLSLFLSTIQRAGAHIFFFFFFAVPFNSTWTFPARRYIISQIWGLTLS